MDHVFLFCGHRVHDSSPQRNGFVFGIIQPSRRGVDVSFDAQRFQFIQN